MKVLIKNHKKLCIILAVIMVFIIVVLVCMRRMEKSGNALMEGLNTQKTVQVERRTIVESISATGSVTSSDSKSITVALSNVEVESVNVEVGDTVQTGEVICVMDSEDVEENLANAKKSLNAADNKSSLDLTAAQRQLDEAVNTKDIDLQRANDEISDAYTDYENAVEDMEDAESALEDARDEAKAKKESYESALNAYNSMVSGGTVSGSDADGGYQELKSRLDQAAEAYKAAQEAEAKADSVYESAKDQANSLYKTYEKQVESRDDKERSDNSSVSSRQESLQNSKISASTSGISEKQQVKTYEQQLENCTVTAPISGVVTQLNVEAGDTYNGSAIAVIENIESYEVTAEIDEYDISKVEIGQKAVIKTNGTGDEELDGTVIRIAPRATAGSNVTYTVTISIDTPNDALRMDMTAKISIIIKSKENVLSVPYESVQEDEDGNYFIQVVDNDSRTQDTMAPAEHDEKASGNGEMPGEGGKPESRRPGADTAGAAARKIYVTKGAESDYYIEIISDEVTEGMEVIVPASDSGMDAQGMIRMQGPMGGF